MDMTMYFFFFRLGEVFGSISKHLGPQVVGNALPSFNQGRRKGSSQLSLTAVMNWSHSLTLVKIKEVPSEEEEIKSILSHICFTGIYKRLRQLLPKFELMSREKSFQEM